MASTGSTHDIALLLSVKICVIQRISDRHPLIFAKRSFVDFDAFALVAFRKRSGEKESLRRSAC
jgi:hypothetical protein